MRPLPPVDFVAYLRLLGTQESQNLVPLSTHEAEIEDYLANGCWMGDLLPWQKTHDLVGLRPGEVSIWAGINGHGKSMITSQVALWLLQTRKVCIVSLEMPIRSQAIRLMRQASGSQLPSRVFRQRFYKWGDDRLWFYDQLDTIPSDRILGIVHYAARELGCNHVVIDSLMKCGIAQDGPGHLTEQTTFVDQLTAAAKSTGCHVHLVHHVRKGEDERRPPGKFDLRGASQIADLADNVFIVHRNKAKEKKVEEGEEVGDLVPDALLIVVKQRNGEWEGGFKLWFQKQSQQFTSAPHKVMPWPSVKDQWGFLKSVEDDEDD